MRITMTQQLPDLRTPHVPCWMRICALVVMTAGTSLLAAQTAPAPAAQTAPGTAQRPVHPRTRPGTAHHPAKPSAATPEPVMPTAPPPPDWPVLSHAAPATITWDSHGLKIQAQNSSLQQILADVATATGAKVEGLGPDERVFGAYGPGQAKDVLSQLLQGSGYNVLLAGDLGQGAPREIVLSPRHAGNAPGTASATTQDNPDEDAGDNDVEDQPPPPPPLVNQPGGFGPGGPIRTPQQVMEEMQRRQLQQQQQQQPGGPGTVPPNPNPQ